MPRKKNIVTTEPWPELRRGRFYEVRIKNAAPDKAAGFLRVTCENLDPGHLGQIHEVKLPLPVRPGNRTCAFLAACGINATAVNTAVDLDRLANVTVRMRLCLPATNASDELDFERIPAPPVTPTDTSTAGSGGEGPRERA
jgi:hypothetical protein